LGTPKKFFKIKEVAGPSLRGFGGVQLGNDQPGNEKGVRMALQGPRAGMEFAGNLSQITISLKK